jgi:hypothetical protein
MSPELNLIEVNVDVASEDCSMMWECNLVFDDNPTIANEHQENEKHSR